MMRNFLSLVLVWLFLPGKAVLAQSYPAAIAAYRDQFIGKPLAHFRFVSLDGVEFRSEHLQGKIVVINCWFTNCQPCIREIPLLNRLVEDNKDKGVVFLAPAPETATVIRKFLKKYPFSYNIIPSASAYFFLTAVENFPTHWVIDTEGVIRSVFIGYSPDIREQLQQAVDQLRAMK